jgi:hypothetical protein
LCAHGGDDALVSIGVGTDDTVNRRNQPVEAQLPRGRCKLGDIDGFGDESVRAQVMARYHVSLIPGPRQDHDGNAAGPFLGAQAAQKSEPTNLRQVKIEDDERWRAFRFLMVVAAPPEQIIESFDAVADHHYLIERVTLVQSARSEFRVFVAILDEQNDVAQVQCAPRFSLPPRAGRDRLRPIP